MGYGETIRDRRSALGLNQAQLAERLGVSRNTVAGWETGHSRPDLDTLPRLCAALDMSVSRFFGGGEAHAEAERRVLDLFFSLAESDREIILWQMEAIRDRRAAMKPAEAVPAVKKAKTPERKSERKPERVAEMPKLVSLYESDLGAAAGFGAPLGEAQGERILLVADAETERADEVITVCGDSMEPTYMDGDRVLVQHQSQIRFGEVGIFLVDNEGYIKEYQQDGLHSHNPAYRVMRFRDGQAVRCIGRVIGKVRPSQVPTEEQIRRYQGQSGK